MTSPAGDLLIPSPARWDEACFSVPAVRALLGSGWNIGLLCTIAQEAFWKTIPGLAIHAVATQESARSIAKQLGGQWRSALVWENGTFADAIRKAGIPRTIGSKSEAWAKWVSDPTDLSVKPTAHRVEFYLSFARSLGQDTRHPALFAPADRMENPTREPLLLLPDSDFGPSHEWSIERWRELINQLTESEHSFRIGYLAQGRRLGTQLAQLIGDNSPLPLETSADALPLLAGFETLIAVDGSLPHLASHAGANCLTLFGPNDPQWKRPLGRRHRTVRHHVECAPCFLARCPLDHRCQTELTAGHVWETFEQWYQEP